MGSRRHGVRSFIVAPHCLCPHPVGIVGVVRQQRAATAGADRYDAALMVGMQGAARARAHRWRYDERPDPYLLDPYLHHGAARGTLPAHRRRPGRPQRSRGDGLRSGSGRVWVFRLIRHSGA